MMTSTPTEASALTAASWLANRWAEPESRAAVAAVFGATAAELTGKIDLHTLGLTLLTAVLAFFFPSVRSAPPAP